jgi:MFS transporter, OPA family, sugar phosphate sensor protein UhpC
MKKSILDYIKTVPASPDRITDPKELKKKYRYWRWRMFYSMYLGYVVFYFTRKNISAVLPIFSKELGISILELGVLSSIFYVTYGIGKFLSGLLADRSNIRFFMAFGLFCASVINIVFGFLETLWLLAFFWGLNGAFQSMGFPPVAKGLVHWFSSEERATKWTLWSSSHTAGTFFIGLIVAFLLKYVGWQSAFYVPGIIGIITSFILFNRLRDRPVSVGLPPIEEYHNHKPPVVAEESLSHLQVLKKYVFCNPYIWSLCIAYIFVYLIRFGTLDWASKFMYDVRGVDKVRVAIMWSIMPLFGMPGGIVAGILSDKLFKGRCTQINIIYLVLLAGSIWGFYSVAGMDHFYATCFFLACIGFLVDGPQNLVGGVQISRITAKESVSAACGLSGLFGYIGAILSGIGLAFVTDRFGWAAMYGVCIASCFIAAFLVALTWKKESEHMDRN